MEPSKRNHKGYWYLVLAVLSITLGPILMIVRGNGASFVEKLVYLTLFVPLGFFVIALNYLREKAEIAIEVHADTQKELLAKTQEKYLKYLLFYIPITLAYAGLCIWLLLGGKF